MAEVRLNGPASSLTCLSWTLRFSGLGSFTLTLTKTDDDDGEDFNYLLREKVTLTTTVVKSDGQQNNVEVLAQESEDFYQVLQYVNLDKPSGLPITVIRRKEASFSLDESILYEDDSNNICSGLDMSYEEQCFDCIYALPHLLYQPTNPTDTMRLAMDSMALLNCPELYCNQQKQQLF